MIAFRVSIRQVRVEILILCFGWVFTSCFQFELSWLSLPSMHVVKFTNVDSWMFGASLSVLSWAGIAIETAMGAKETLSINSRSDERKQSHTAIGMSAESLFWLGLQLRPWLGFWFWCWFWFVAMMLKAPPEIRVYILLLLLLLIFSFASQSLPQVFISWWNGCTHTEEGWVLW